MTATKTFDYDGYSVEVYAKDDESSEQKRFAESQRIQEEYAGRGIHVSLATARDIAIFNADEDLYFDDDKSDPSGLDPDRSIPPELIQRIKGVGLETAIAEQSIADAYGCAVSCKPNYLDADFAFPSENAWKRWHMGSLKNAIKNENKNVMDLPESILEEIKNW